MSVQSPERDTSRDAFFDRYASTFYARPEEAALASIFRTYDHNLHDLLPASRTARIIDVGCGAGVLLRFVKSKGYTNVVGWELSKDQVEACHRAGLTEVRKVDDTRLELLAAPKQFDMVLMTDVLEHVQKPEILPLLEAIRGSLAPGGIAVFRVPNLASFTGAYSRYHDFTHEVGFVEKSLAQVLKIAGFEQVQVRAERHAFRSPIKGALFLGAQSMMRLVRRACMFLEVPGSDLPHAFSANIIGIGRVP
ncbi:MAG: class I SAM-dependent methyltransferase [Myxococcota bacterium]